MGFDVSLTSFKPFLKGVNKMSKEVGLYRISEQTEKMIIELRVEGLSTYKIADQVGVTRPTVEKYINLHKTLIEEMRQARLDALKEAIDLNRIRRLEILSNELERVEKQLEARNLDELKTAELIKIKIQLITTIEKIEQNFEDYKEKDGNNIDDILREIEEEANAAK
jgi:predicted transcriptional regulator